MNPWITGVGIVSAYGLTLEAFMGGLKTGASCAKPIAQFDATGCPTTIAAEVPVTTITPEWLITHLNPTYTQQQLLDQWWSKRWLTDRKVSFALLAATEAWTMASGTSEMANHTWSTVAMGLERAHLEDFDHHVTDDGIDWSAISAQPDEQEHMRIGVDVPQRALTTWLGINGPQTTHVSACAAGGISIAHGAQLIRRGLADVVLCGATDAMINPLGLGGMSRLGAPSPRPHHDACRPFDLHRDGLLMGEGAAILVLESPEHARQRGAKPLATVKGWGITQDGWRTTAPREDGQQAARAMAMALTNAQLRPSDIEYINAHGTGTPLNDVAETQAIKTVFGENTPQIAVSSIKGAIGHAMAASGALEAIAALAPITHNLWPMTTNLTQPDPRCDLNLITSAPLVRPCRHTLSNSFGFGGQNVSLIFGAHDE